MKEEVAVGAPQSKLRASTTMTSREFNQHTGRAKAAADKGPVFITDRGRPTHVLLSSAEFERLSSAPRRPFVSAAEAFADPNWRPDDVDIMDYIPERRIDPPRDPFGDD